MKRRRKRRGRPRKPGVPRKYPHMAYEILEPLGVSEAKSLLAQHAALRDSPPGYLATERRRRTSMLLTCALRSRVPAAKLAFVRELVATVRPADVPPATWLALSEILRNWPARVRRLACYDSERPVERTLSRLDAKLRRLAVVVGADAGVLAANLRYWYIRKRYKVKRHERNDEQ